MQADAPNGPTNLHRWDKEDINMYYPRPATAAGQKASATAPSSEPVSSTPHTTGHCLLR
jgi:hypothetical protein